VKRIAEIFAENLRRLRKSRDLSQQALAERVGVSVITIQNYEAMRRWPSPESVCDLAQALAVLESEFFSDPAVELSREQLVFAVSEALGVFPEPKRNKPKGNRLSGRSRFKSK
jgi:transcriptional regulator with XRE-family HTH domain